MYSILFFGYMRKLEKIIFQWTCLSLPIFNLFFIWYFYPFWPLIKLFWYFWVGVTVWSMFRCSQCFGAVSVQVRLIFEVPQGLSLAGICATAPKISTVLKYWPGQNIDRAITLTVPNHWQHQNIDRAKT